LSVIARELGFSSWTHAHHLLDGENPSDFGTLLCPPGSSAHWNIWCASYDEARRIREEHGGFLLGYRHQFLITDRHFIEHLGLDPDDEDWQRIGRDWVRPADPHARRRLYGRLIEATAPAG
ncbi:MAG: hypothetical protein KDC38_19605, partial [Planctomycetes bacterium]|nr:hypothetical protein [Planctomycetota bacterium]